MPHGRLSYPSHFNVPRNGGMDGQDIPWDFRWIGAYGVGGHHLLQKGGREHAMIFGRKRIDFPELFSILGGVPH